MPFKNFHTCRLADPAKYSEFATVEREHEGKKYLAVRGKLKDAEDWQDQAFRYPIETWSESEAHKHCRDHSGILFEPAQDSASLNLLFSRPWAIKPDVFSQVNNVVKNCALFDDLIQEEEEKSLVTVHGDVGIITISGVIVPKLSLREAIYGGVSVAAILRDFSLLLQDGSIRSIVFDIDSPGGVVDGVSNLSKHIYDSRSIKPTTSIVNHLAASAAYWIASGAEKVYMASNTAETGSIGVVAVHRDISEFENKVGIKTTEIVSGKYKRAVSMYKPLDQAGREFLQAQADYIYSVFVADVARNRGVTAEKVIDGMAEGRIFIGKQAVDIGLADGIFSIDEFVNKEVLFMPQEQQEITVDYLVSNCPDVVEAIRQKAFSEGVQAGKTQERERIAGIDELTLPGFENLAVEAKLDGETTAEQFSAMQAKKIKENGISMLALQQETKPVSFVGDCDSDQAEKDKKQLVSAMASGLGGKKKSGKEVNWA